MFLKINLGCDVVQSAGSVDPLLEISLVYQNLVFTAAVVRQNVTSFLKLDVAPCVLETYVWNIWRYCGKTIDLNVHSKLNSGMEFCVHGHSIQCAICICYIHTDHTLGFSFLFVAYFTCMKRLLNKERFFLSSHCGIEVLKCLWIHCSSSKWLRTLLY